MVDHSPTISSQRRLRQSSSVKLRRSLTPMQKKSALLCYEADPNGCHRLIVAEHLHERLGLEIENL